MASVATFIATAVESVGRRSEAVKVPMPVTAVGREAAPT